MKLSEHFTLAEATRSATAERRDIDNTPPDDIIPSLAAVAENILEPVREHFDVPFAPSSWYRGPELNEAIGGSARSQHVKGEAVDFELPHVDNWELAEWCYRNLDFDQLIVEFMVEGDPTAGWVHCSYRDDGGNRGNALRIQRGTGYQPWSP